MLFRAGRHSRGQEAEHQACTFLEAQGLNILERNYRCRQGEIDIIATSQDTVIFVEVRFRKNAQFGSGAESVTRSKQQKLLMAARSYLVRRLKREPPCRFDVLEASSRGDGSLQFNWLQNAFQE